MCFNPDLPCFFCVAVGLVDNEEEEEDFEKVRGLHDEDGDGDDDDGKAVCGPHDDVHDDDYDCDVHGDDDDKKVVRGPH